mmetsp:Transcript_65974/g.115440  ORF Transcript_65974/g.115440 Transcript_65974/m.115440 type:complete len:820 (-) Transcript_65974:206-2665(-)
MKQFPRSFADVRSFFAIDGPNLRERTAKRLWWQIPIFFAFVISCYLYQVAVENAQIRQERLAARLAAPPELRTTEIARPRFDFEAARRLHSNTDPLEPDNCAGVCKTGEQQALEDEVAKEFILINAKNMLNYEDECFKESDSDNPMARFNSKTKLAVLKKEKMPWIIWYIFGVIYCFIGLAVVCDEFFVPALECFVDEFGISMDVAGATFMAAGGSMPELATSFIGTFRDSELGFVTIVGSAVFNVLFVIAVCAIASPEVLPLTWWPLARDCSFYILALFTVVFVFEGHSKNTIDWWEALLLFSEYIGYCTFMKFNSRVNNWVEEKLMKKKKKASQVGPEEDAGDGAEKKDGEAEKEGENHNLRKPSTFRTGIVQLLTKNRYLYETAGIAAVTQIQGKLEETFKTLDKDNDGALNVDEIKTLLSELGCKTDNLSVLTAIRRMTSGEQMVTFESFKKWYVVSEARVQSEVYSIFHKFDTDGNGVIDFKEIKSLLVNLGHKPNEKDLRAVVDELREFCKEKAEPSKDGDGAASDGPSAKEPIREAAAASPPPGAVLSEVVSFDADKTDDFKINFHQFSNWYEHSFFYQKKIAQQEAESEAMEHITLDYPDNPCWSALFWYVFTYPVVAVLYCTLPDVRHPKLRRNYKVAIIEFSLCLVWIAIINLWLVECLIVVSQTIRIPVPVAAVTLLAAGTSVPDLLSSYVVAKNKEGDMAVSSSIGSNIFDVTVGLPLPWLCYCIYRNKSFYLGENGSQGLAFNVILLISMLAAVIGTIMAMKWRMNKAMGYMMFVLYILFVVQYLLQKMPTRCAPKKDGVFQIEIR